jgi:hypothetical protein
MRRHALHPRNAVLRTPRGKGDRELRVIGCGAKLSRPSTVGLLESSTVGLVADDSDRSWQRSSSKGAGCGIDQPSRRKPVDSTIG